MSKTKRLVIAEKPSVARDLAAALGPFEEQDGGEWFETDQYVIAYAVGHLLELAPPERYDEQWKRWSLKTLPIIPEAFRHEPRDRKAASRLSLLRKLAKRNDVAGVVNACDAGREGEHIFRTIQAELKRDLPAERLWLSSLTRDAIRAGFQELRPHERYDDLGAAAACRAEADWLIGINATRALTGRLRSLGYQGAWTSGRVQTPTLAMCVERELEIQAHRPEPYWEIKATFQASDHTYESMYRLPKGQAGDNPTRIFDREQMEHLAGLLQKGAPAVASEKRQRRKDEPPLPFDLTTLQRASGLTAKRTQDIAQALYERHKVLSYPRTDSRYLPADQRPGLDENLDKLASVRALRPVVDAIRDKGVQNAGKVFNDAKVSDHHAIIPVGVPRPGQLDDTEYRIYMMVVRQYLAAFMEPAYWESVTRWTHLDVRGEDLRFHASGRRLVHAGYQLAMGKEVGHGSSLATLEPSEGAPVSLEAWEIEESETKPRGRLTDAGLVARMENCGKDIEDEALSEIMRERGLGTPATRADTIERLIHRGYLAREGKSLRATAKAIRLIETLRRAGALKLTEPELTGEMEYKLRQVEHGNLVRDRYMGEVVEDTKLITDILVHFDFDELYADDEDIAPCPVRKDLPVRENVWGFTCGGPDAEEELEEPFFIWKDVGGHVLTPQEMRELIDKDDHQLGPVTLYPRNNPRGGGYQAMLALRRLADDEYEAVQDKRKKKRKKSARAPSRWTVDIKPLTATGEVADEIEEERIRTLCAIPDEDGEGEIEIVETNLRYVDAETYASGQRKPRAMLPKTVCQRPMSEEEALQYFQEGKTDLLEDFTSKRGRPFKAKLYLKGNGRHGFEFEPRKPRKGKGGKKAAGDEAPAKKSGAKKTAAKKSGGTKKASGKKTAAKKSGAKKAATKKATTKKSTTKRGSSKKAASERA